MAIQFRCDNCNTLLRASEDKAGRRAKCPHCGFFVQTPQPDDSAGDGFDYDLDDPDDEDSFSRQPGTGGPSGGAPADSGDAACPTCGAGISATARECPYCGELMGTAARQFGAAHRPYGYAPTSGLAVASLVLGIVGIVFFCLCFVSIPCNVLAIVFGAVAMNQTKKGEASGHGMALAGLILGIIGLLLSVGIWLPGIGMQQPGWKP